MGNVGTDREKIALIRFKIYLQTPRVSTGSKTFDKSDFGPDYISAIFKKGNPLGFVPIRTFLQFCKKQDICNRNNSHSGFDFGKVFVSTRIKKLYFSNH